MTMIELSRRYVIRAFISTITLACCAFTRIPSANAETVIRHPGQHPQYSFELEPHLAVDWADAHWAGSGIGPGLHAAIPIMHQGPISTINNNMAIKFGLDVTFGNGCYWGGPRYSYNRNYCDTTTLLLPVALQWNFYVTDMIVPFGEVGMAIGHTWWSYDYAVCANGVACPASWSETYPLLYTAVGAKFMFGRTAGLTVRMGYPHVTIGASILF